MKKIYLDIETVPTKDQLVMDKIHESIKPPGNISKAETLLTWEIEKKPGLVQDAIAKTSFDGTYGSICCIGWAHEGFEAQAYASHNEVDVLMEFCERLCDCNKFDHPITIIGHNVSWDLRFLWQRMVIHDLKPAKILSSFPWQVKPWDERIQDTMLLWNPDRERRISLDALCHALGVPSSKGDMDGSEVARYASEKRYTEISEYCKLDVEATRHCYRRMTNG